ncbi:hypothetical protein TNCV_1022071 [Trichonephila clavipes]|nr:hypothetical protein TNCV_1022071 [Trichonephila clavipes]
MTPELAPFLLTTTPHQMEDVSALDRFNVHRYPTRWVFSSSGSNSGQGKPRSDTYTIRLPRPRKYGQKRVPKNPFPRSSTISGLTWWLESEGCSKLDDGRKGSSPQDGYRMFAWTFFFQTQRQDYE